MPIYAYRCSACGHSKDVLQRMSDPVLHTCPVCAAESFTKQVTAAGFQLKGSGWYATDFKGSGAAPAPASSKDSKDSEGGEGKSASSDQTAAAPAADKPATPAAVASSTASAAKSSAATAAPAP